MWHDVLHMNEIVWIGKEMQEEDSFMHILVEQ